MLYAYRDDLQSGAVEVGKQAQLVAEMAEAGLEALLQVAFHQIHGDGGHQDPVLDADQVGRLFAQLMAVVEDGPQLSDSCC